MKGGTLSNPVCWARTASCRHPLVAPPVAHRWLRTCTNLLDMLRHLLGSELHLHAWAGQPVSPKCSAYKKAKTHHLSMLPRSLATDAVLCPLATSSWVMHMPHTWSTLWGMRVSCIACMVPAHLEALGILGSTCNGIPMTLPLLLTGNKAKGLDHHAAQGNTKHTNSGAHCVVQHGMVWCRPQRTSWQHSYVSTEGMHAGAGL